MIPSDVGSRLGLWRHLQKLHRRIMSMLAFQPAVQIVSPIKINIITTSLDVLVAVGSGRPRHSKAEKLEGGSWSDIEEAPVGGYFAHYAVIFDAGNFYYFGGYNGGVLNTIFRLSGETWTWSNAGRLNSARSSHGAALVEDTFMVIGGYSGNKPNEACLLNNGQFTCEVKPSSLTNYYYNIIFNVSDDYGLC